MLRELFQLPYRQREGLGHSLAQRMGISGPLASGVWRSGSPAQALGISLPSRFLRPGGTGGSSGTAAARKGRCLASVAFRQMRDLGRRRWKRVGYPRRSLSETAMYPKKWSFGTVGRSGGCRISGPRFGCKVKSCLNHLPACGSATSIGVSQQGDSRRESSGRCRRVRILTRKNPWWHNPGINLDWSSLELAGIRWGLERPNTAACRRKSFRHKHVRRYTATYPAP